jgi:hypothetical protein
MKLDVKYINLQSGKAEEAHIKDLVEEIEFWNRQRAGEVSVISVQRA